MSAVCKINFNLTKEEVSIDCIGANIESEIRMYGRRKVKNITP